MLTLMYRGNFALLLTVSRLYSYKERVKQEVVCACIRRQELACIGY